MILDEIAANSSEVDRWEEALEVYVQHEAPSTMLVSIGYNRAATPEAVFSAVAALSCHVDFIHAVLQEIGDATLEELEASLRSIDCALATIAFWNAEVGVLLDVGLDVQDVRKAFWLEIEDASYVAQ